MLDVSRCKVPTMDTLYSLIDLLAQLRINELQLYIEHTFAFEKHDAVWKDSSPFSGREIQLIDQYCKERFIELVPNLNSFGHFERWLRHDQYKHLAECPQGFKRENPYMVRDHGTTLKPNQESLDFIDSLYAEYLPHFSSNKFNVGMDEPWELGQGWNGQSSNEDDIAQAIEKLVHGNHKPSLSSALIELGKLDRVIGSNIANTSLSWHLLFAPLPNKLLDFIRENHTTQQLKEGILFLQSVQELNAKPTRASKSKLIENEISWGVQISTIALQKGIDLP